MTDQENILAQFPTINSLYGKVVRDDLARSVSKFPLARLIKIKHLKYLAGVDFLLSDSQGIPGFEAVIRDSFNPESFYDTLTTLQFSELLKQNRYEILEIFGSSGNFPRPDIKFRLSDKVAYAECKHIVGSDDIMNDLQEHFEERVSPFIVHVTVPSGILYKSSVGRIIAEVECKIEKKQAAKDLSVESIETPGVATCELHPRRSGGKGPTGLSVLRSFEKIGPGLFRQRIEQCLSDARRQLNAFPEDCGFLFIDSDLVKLSSNEMDTLLYGNQVVEHRLDVAMQKPEWKRLEKAQRAGQYELLTEKGFIPKHTSNKMNGLFLDECYDKISSMTFVDISKRVYGYPNPFGDHVKISAHLILARPHFPLSSSWIDDVLSRNRASAQASA